MGSKLLRIFYFSLMYIAPRRKKEISPLQIKVVLNRSHTPRGSKYVWRLTFNPETKAVGLREINTPPCYYYISARMELIPHQIPYGVVIRSTCIRADAMVEIFRPPDRAVRYIIRQTHILSQLG